MMTSYPLVSFIVPVYNAAAYIVQAIESALNQTYPNIEVVAVDDGSTDDSADIIRQHFGHNPRVRYFYQTNSGPAAARNHALRMAQGEFVHFLDADEFILPTKVEKSYALFTPEIGVVYGHGIAVRPDGVTVIPMEQPPLPSGDVFCEWLNGTMSGGTHGVVSSVMARREAVLTVGGFNESIKGTEDWDLWLRLASRYKFTALDEKLVYYRRIESGVHANRVNMAKCRLKTIQLARHYHGREKCLDDAAYDRLEAGRWSTYGARLWESGNRAEARAAFAEAIKLDPRPLRYFYRYATYFLPHTVMDLVNRIR